MSDFHRFADAAIDALQQAGDLMPAFALADWLQDHGDLRGVRLRRRLQRAQRDDARAERTLAEVVAGDADPKRSFIVAYYEEFRSAARHAVYESLITYIHRLLSVRGNEPLIREDSSYCFVEPGE